MFAFAYGVGAYVVFVLTFFYSVGFVENWLVAFTIDGAPGAGVGHPRGWLLNVILLGLFGAQHSLMGHPEVRRVWRAFLPPVLERSTHVLVSCVLLMLVFLRWTPMPFVVWDLGFNPVAFGVEMLSYTGWVFALAATFQLDHLELFGLKQVFCHARGEDLPQSEFQTPTFYRWVRHPIYLSLLVAFWCAPRMTLGHLLFAALATVYVRFVVRLEERGLVLVHPEYRVYQARVPMLNPFQRRTVGNGSGRQARPERLGLARAPTLARVRRDRG